ncbi:MAG: hypothetical protein NC483_01375 [Ruminococcus sp.]|nr:hypothetical protein [Ruminococcus sp.]
MKIEKLRNKNSTKYFLYGLISVVVLTITVTFIASKAEFRVTASIPLTEGKVVSSPYDINVMAVYIKETDTYRELDKTELVPSVGYILNESESYCCKGSNCKKENKDTNVTLKTVAGLHTFSGVSKSDKCYLYFDFIDVDKPTTMKELLQNYYINKQTRIEETFNERVNAASKNTIFVDADNDGETYYFAGNTLDNWVYFANFYWRIVRVNGDGSIRLIYQGKTTNTKEEAAIIGRGAFTSYQYVGYWYNYNDTLTPSNAYNVANTWFKETAKLTEPEYFNKIDLNAGFCNDTTSYKDKEGTIQNSGNTPYYYGAYTRYTNLSPSFNCPNNEDLYTYSSASKGNKRLEYPIGYLTIDEALFAGNYGQWSPSYLTTTAHFWTISPSYNNGQERIFGINPSGNIDNGTSVNAAWSSGGLRPVINLRSDVTLTGSGTSIDPYKVV